MKKNFNIDIEIRKIVRNQGMVIIYTDKPRALGEILRHKYGIHKLAMTIWGQGVTLLPDEFKLVQHEFEGIEINVV